jgi:hypothetical protein
MMARFPTIFRLKRLATLVSAIALATFTVVGIPQVSHAQEDSVTIEVEIILASDSGDGVASELRPYAGRLQSQFSQFDSFRRLTSTSFTLNIGEDESISIPGVGSAGFSFAGLSGSRFKLDVSVPGGGTTVESPRGGIFFVGGPRAPGGTIILLIRTE